MHRVLCFGGRTYEDMPALTIALDMVAAHLGALAVVHGGARGADDLAGAWARKRGVPLAIVPAPWDFYGKRAGTLRNSWMISLCQPTYAVGFPGGVGSANMASQCRAAGIPLWLPYAA
jgi:hypothetical protein